MRTRRRSGILAALCAAWLGCSDGGGGADADVADADLRPDAFDPCPGQLTFEALVSDLLTGEAVPIADVRDTAGEQTSSAPNGRAVLCLDPGVDKTLELAKTDYLTTRYALDAEAAGEHEGTAAFPAPMITTNDADTLVSSLGQTRDAADALLLVEVLSYPGAEAAIGASVEISQAGHDGAFVEDGAGDFVPGSTLTDGARVLFVNVPPDGGSTMLTVTAPAGRSCVGPAAVPLQGGELSYTFLACL